MVNGVPTAPESGFDVNERPYTAGPAPRMAAPIPTLRIKTSPQPT